MKKKETLVILKRYIKARKLLYLWIWATKGWRIRTGSLEKGEGFR
jgi:hypothetical protein